MRESRAERSKEVKGEYFKPIPFTRPRNDALVHQNAGN